MIPQRLVIGGHVRDALGEVEHDACETMGVEVDFLVVGDLADGAEDGVSLGLWLDFKGRRVDEKSEMVKGCMVVRNDEGGTHAECK